jgi:glycogen debranching enzyme
MAERARESFNRLFWNQEMGCLYDVVDGDARDGSVRPNQVFAISLTHSMVSAERAEQILVVIERELLTPRGLRSLSPDDPRYAGRYEGDSRTRDSVYHQGTVWPWLMGSYITAYVKTFGEQIGRKVAEACLGQVSEIFDADGPHAPRGCVGQAWSVAEILRAAVEDVYRIKPTTRAVGTV